MDFAFKEETRKLVGWAMEVHRELGPGLSEKPYEIAQMMSYLRVTGLAVGLIISFAAPRLQWKRVAFNKPDTPNQGVNLR